MQEMLENILNLGTYCWSHSEIEASFRFTIWKLMADIYQGQNISKGFFMTSQYPKNEHENWL